MNVADIREVNLFKIDAQGEDLAVIKSAGDRLRDIMKISREVDPTNPPLYVGAASKKQVADLLEEAGFDLVAAEKQSHGQEENLTFLRRT